MDPVRTEWTELVYRGISPDVGDLWCHRQAHGCIMACYDFTPEERETVANGGRVVISLLTEPIPPISLMVMTGEETEPIGRHPFKVIKELEERDGR